MEESTIGTYLGYASFGTASEAQKDKSIIELPVTDEKIATAEFKMACDITDYPDLSSPAERIETTTLSKKRRTYIKGLEDAADQQFTANFDRTTYETIDGFGNEQKVWAVLFEESKTLFWFVGQSDISVEGKGVGDVRTAKLTLYPNDETHMDKNNWVFDSSTKTIKKEVPSA